MTRDEARELYRLRFSRREIVEKGRLWQVLCEDFLQARIAPGSTVLDVGAGSCEFVNHVKAARRLALDVNPDVGAHAAPGVEVLVGEAAAIPLTDASVDVAFASNFLEHLADKAAVRRVLGELARVLRPGGSLLLLQPNFRFAYSVYWDFWDHHVALTDRSLAEVLRVVGLEPVEVIPRFLPYTTKSRLPASPPLLRLYLRLRPVWRVFGRQMFVRATRAA